MGIKLSSLGKKKFTPAPETEPETTDEATDLSKMDRAELKAYIKEKGLDVEVFRSMSDDDIREKIAEAEKGAEAEPEAEEPEKDGEEKDGEVDLSELDRAGLKKLIADNDLAITVTKGMSDDDIRDKIAELLGASTEAEPEAEPEAEAEQEAEAEPDAESEEKPAKKGKLAFLVKPGDVNKEVATVDASSKRSRAPTFYIPDGETKTVTLRDNESLGGLYMYSVHNGVRWTKVTQPPEGEIDLFARAGRNPQFNVLYEVFDRDGYTDKKTGKKLKDLPRFWLVTQKMHKQLMHIKAKQGDLTKIDLEIHREGKKQPAYTIQVAPTTLPASAKKQPRLADEIAEFFAPPTEAEQRRMLHTTEEADEE